MKRRAALLLLTLLASTAPAVEVRTFDDPAKEARYGRLIEELRCLVCQNQSLADSDADLARDLRDEVYAIIQSGQDEQQAIRFLTDRYGDFVLYRPPVKPMTWLLWGGPILFLLAGGAFLWRRQSGRRDGEGANPMTDEERLRLERLKRELMERDHS